MWFKKKQIALPDSCINIASDIQLTFIPKGFKSKNPVVAGVHLR
jgi:hypothetical protein